ncbi:MAG: fimbrillin family protein [Muribaculaceae bacterium]|nr:fimbrillin family protein [Muribaculaceae bacterium]
MLKSILKYLFLVSAVFFTGCSMDDLMLPDGNTGNGDDLQLNISIDNFYGNTRASGVPGAKISFTPGDVIHITAVYNTATQENASTQYGAYEMGADGKWTQIGNYLMWPNEAVSASFSAYYIPGLTDVITDGATTEAKLLSDITTYDPETLSYSTDDPLVAHSTGTVKYGHSINLRFSHLCTYLTITDLEAGISREFFLSVPDRGYSAYDSEQTDFTNAYQISREGNELKFEFVALESQEFNNNVFVSAYTRETNSSGADSGSGDSGLSKLNLIAGFFLPPGIYHDFLISYPGVAPRIYPYIEYNYIGSDYSIDEDYPETYPALKANYSYSLDITKSQGITITPPSTDEDWDNSPGIGVNVPDFMDAVLSNSEYWWPSADDPDAKKILEPLENGTGVRLLENVDFEFKNDERNPYGIDFSVGTFEGGHHQIQNLSAPLFRQNNGNIRNLWLNTARYKITASQSAVDTEDHSRLGLICGFNRSDGDIVNVRVQDVDLTYVVNTLSAENQERNFAFNLGILVGSNAGDLDDVELMGSYTLTIEDDPANLSQNTVDASVLSIGGLVGQMASGSLTNVSPASEFSMNIVNNCKGSGDLNNKRRYNVGGALGVCGYNIENIVLPNVNIDCTNSISLVSAIGGISGTLDVSADNPTASGLSIKGCIVSGSLKAGEIIANDIASQSYIGGLVGYVNTFNVFECRSTCNVQGTMKVVQPYIVDGGYEPITYGTGGAFGRISNTSSILEDIVAYGTSLEGAVTDNPPTGFESYIGNFIGIAPAGVSWDTDYSSKATVRNFGYNMLNIP